MQPLQFFKALSDPTRLNLILQLRISESVCVCDLTEKLEQPQPTISRHLNHLLRANLVTKERRGTWMWYAINQDLPQWCLDVIYNIDMSTAIENDEINTSVSTKSCC